MDRVGLEWLRPSWDGDRSAGIAADLPVQPVQGVGTAEQHPRRGELLQPGHEMHHLSHDRWRLLCIARGAADHHRSRVYPQAHFKRYVLLRSGIREGLVQASLEGEPREHRPPGVILQGHRDAKEHQKAVVAHGLEGALIRLDLVVDQVEQGLAQAWQRLQTQALDQGDRIRQGPTQHGHQLAFPHEGSGESGGRLCWRLPHLPRTVRCDLRCPWPIPTSSLLVEDLDGCDKAIATAAERFDDALLPSAVPSSFAGGCHMLVDGAIADAVRRPEVRNQFLLGDDAITMRHEVGEHIEHLGSQGQGFPP